MLPSLSMSSSYRPLSVTMCGPTSAASGRWSRQRVTPLSSSLFPAMTTSIRMEIFKGTSQTMTPVRGNSGTTEIQQTTWMSPSNSCILLPNWISRMSTRPGAFNGITSIRCRRLICETTYLRLVTSPQCSAQVLGEANSRLAGTSKHKGNFLYRKGARSWPWWSSV